VNSTTPSALTAINEVVTRRIAQLKTDIAEAEAILASYREELEPLTKIAQVAASLTLPVTAAGYGSDAIPSRRWAHLNLQPRWCRVIDQFAPKGTVTREEINEWYKRAMSPGIARNSVMTMSLEITKSLVSEGVLKAIGPDRWQFNEPTAPVAEPTAPVAEPTAPVAEPAAPTVLPNNKRYSHYRLAPRERAFLDRFSTKSVVNRPEISEWYHTVNANLTGESVRSAVSEITRNLIAKGILARDGMAQWRIVR
jgi:hypothetical protein